ncbi:MAG: hypothetical protein U9Q37_05025 [Euryarchaeota archaeon]|nr:hypothetical protein [Euryarchaeota archaeon]
MTVPYWARDKVVDAVRKLADLGVMVYATRGTKEFLDGAGVPSELVLKLHEGRPNNSRCYREQKDPACV